MFATEEIRQVERPSAVSGECPLCRTLAATYAARFAEYIGARASASYAVSKKMAAQKNVEMERARDEMEEHRLSCPFAGAANSRADVAHDLGQLVA